MNVVFHVRSSMAVSNHSALRSLSLNKKGGTDLIVPGFAVPVSARPDPESVVDRDGAVA